jgi:hypothetical protein
VTKEPIRSREKNKHAKFSGDVDTKKIQLHSVLVPRLLFFYFDYSMSCTYIYATGQ